MKKLMQVFASVMIATSTFGGVTSVAAKENTPAYKIEYQNADSMQSVFTKELHQKYANVKFKKKSSNSRTYTLPSLQYITASTQESSTLTLHNPL